MHKKPPKREYTPRSSVDYKQLFVRAMKLADKYAGTKKQRWVAGCNEADYLEYMKLKELEP